MALKSKYGWSREDMVRYIYGELKDEHISSLINNCIEKSDRDIIEILSDIRMTKAFRGFKTSNEHITTISREASLHTAKLAEKYGLELNEGRKINPNETNNTASIASSISKKGWIIIVILASIVIVGGIMWFNQNKNVELPIQEQQEPPPIASILEEELKTFPQIALIGKTRSSGDSVLNKIHELIYIQKDYNSANEIILNEIKKGGENESIFQYTIGLSYLRIGDIENSIRYLQMVVNNSNNIYQLDAKEQLIYAFIKNEQYDKASILVQELKKIEDYQEKMELLEISLTKHRKDFQ